MMTSTHGLLIFLGVLVFLAVQVVSSGFTSQGCQSSIDLPEYTINLDDPPEVVHNKIKKEKNSNNLPSMKSKQ